MKVTIRDLAREAGVSVATISRVLNDSGPVSASTRERIRAIAARLRYTPDGAALSLITRRTSTLGVLLPDLYGEFFSEVIRGIDQTAQRHGYHLIVSSSHNHRGEVEAALRAMRGRVDGVLLMSPDLDAPGLLAELPESLPVVLLNSPIEGGFDSLSIDNYGGAQGMTWHLIERGHRRIAIIEGPARNHDARERSRGYQDALAAAGIEFRREWGLEGDFTEGGGHAAACRLLELSPRPTAVFAANDSMAIGAISALHDAGVRVPEDMAIGGFDDIPVARYLSPPLTTVQVPIGELGERAVSCLVHAVSAQEEHRRAKEVLPTTLVIRRSTGLSGGASGPDARISRRTDARHVVGNPFPERGADVRVLPQNDIDRVPSAPPSPTILPR